VSLSSLGLNITSRTLFKVKIQNTIRCAHTDTHNTDVKGCKTDYHLPCGKCSSCPPINACFLAVFRSVKQQENNALFEAMFVALSYAAAQHRHRRCVRPSVCPSHAHIDSN